jgi:hypothetical protein
MMRKKTNRIKVKAEPEKLATYDRGSGEKLLKRWKLLDAWLAGLRETHLNIPAFARQHGCTDKTIRRDLHTFYQVGHVAVRYRKDKRTFWRYKIPNDYLFASNLKSSAEYKASH